MVNPICIVEHDDPDMELLSGHIEATVLRLGLPSERYSLEYRSHCHWAIGDGESQITSSDVENAPFIWYRRWRVSPPRPATTATTKLGPDAGVFIERQWETTMRTLFQAGHAANEAKWSRAPQRLDNKIHTNDVLDALGLLPETHVALIPPPGGAEWVWKPIDVDQSVGGSRAAAITVATADQTMKQPCPGFYQRAVAYETELRVAYVFGEVAAVSQQPQKEIEFIDKRYVDMIRTAFNSDELTMQTKRVGQATGLNMFTADVLLDSDNRLWWIDINQDGLFCAADSPDGHLLSTVRQQFSQKGRMP